MKRIVAGFAVLALVAGAVASAEHQEERDVRIGLTSPTSATSRLGGPIGRAGGTLYRAQEGLHAEVADATGEEIEHFYVWICLEDACVPVDPFTVNR